MSENKTTGIPESETFEAKEPEPEKQQDVIDKIQPRKDPVKITLTLDGQSEDFYQKPLTVFRKIEFFGLVGRTIEEIVDGPGGVNIDSIFGAESPTSFGEIRDQDFSELSNFLSAVAKVASYAPEFLKESYLIILGVPHNLKNWARIALDEIDDDTGEQILVTFVDQNYKDLEDFFTERAQRIFKRVQEVREEK